MSTPRTVEPSHRKDAGAAIVSGWPGDVIDTAATIVIAAPRAEADQLSLAPWSIQAAMVSIFFRDRANPRPSARESS